ncbi:hypothetical protein Tco_0307374 [Tanacetum coccineum]
MNDSQMDDMIKEKLALKQQIDSLKKNLSKQIKEKESLLQTFTVFKSESKEKEKINAHIKKVQSIKPTLYDGAVISKTHVTMLVIDDEETLILKEESRSKMFEKAKDPEVIAKKISHKPIDYEKLNSLIEDFETRFSPQQELSAEQTFSFHTFNPTIEPSYSPPVIVDVPSELPKDLKAQIQDKVFVITSLKNDLRKSKCKEIVENVVHIPSATTIAPGMFKLDLVSLTPGLLQNREVHINYLRNTQEQANILREIVDQAKAKQPLDGDLDLACKYVTRIQELLVYVQDTYPNAITPSTKKVVVTPMNNVKKVRFVEPLTSSSNIKQVESSNTLDSNTPVLSSTRVKCSTSNCGSKPSSNKKNDRISQTPSKNKKNKVEAQPRKLNKVNCVVKPVYDVDVKHSLLNAISKILCATCNKSMFDGVHDKCLLDLVQNRNNHTKSAKKHKKQNIWKPTGHVFTEVGFKWKPTGKTFTIVGNSCPFNLITLTNLAKDGLARGIPRLKFQKDHLCSACALRKSKKTSHQPKAEDTNQGKLYLLHMDLCGLMRMASINGKSAGLGSNPISQLPCLPPKRDDWDRLFQPMFDEYFNPPPIAVSLRSTFIDQDAPSTSIPSSQEYEQSPIISQGFEESPKTPTFHDDPLNESPNEITRLLNEYII